MGPLAVALGYEEDGPVADVDGLDVFVGGTLGGGDEAELIHLGAEAAAAEFAADFEDVELGDIAVGEAEVDDRARWGHGRGGGGGGGGSVRGGSGEKRGGKGRDGVSA